MPSLFRLRGFALMTKLYALLSVSVSGFPSAVPTHALYVEAMWINSPHMA